MTKKIGDGEKKIGKKEGKERKKKFSAIIYDKDFLEENIFPWGKLEKNSLNIFQGLITRSMPTLHGTKDTIK